ncbi:DnaD domain protein [Anaerobacillus sp. MEB173]|uniref:DnaD domain protein n=1 Tax=Anaerobacillus sp. MEB173 TaxID=3383345 RepID=UPI003F92AB10
MNYIKELNAFYDRLETNPLSTSAVALWHALLHINNKTAWVPEFAVAVSVLCTKTGLSERAISKARSELKQKGYIDFCSRKGNQSALYQLRSVSFKSGYDNMDYHTDNRADNSCYADKPYDNCAENSSDNHSNKGTDKCTGIRTIQPTTNNRSDNSSDNCSESHSENRTALNKQNETSISNSLSLYEIFEKSFNRVPTPMQIDILASFIDQDGLPEELVLYGLSIAGEKGKPFSYAKSILTNWCKGKIRTVEEAKHVSEEYYARKNNITTFPKLGGAINEQDRKRINDGTGTVTNFKFYK